MIIMTRLDFFELLKEYNIDSNLVVFDDPVKEGYCIRKNCFRWEVFYRERGKEYNCIGFPSESNALQYLFDELYNLYVKSKAQSMQQIIEQVLLGHIDIDAFIAQLQTDPALQGFLYKLLPSEAKTNSGHDFWKVFPYTSLQRNQFDFCQFLFWGLHSRCKFGVRLTVFDRLQRLYLYHYPDLACTDKYEKQHDLYLDVVKDCFDGPEVRSTVEKLLDEALQYPTKKARKANAQAAVAECFHIQNNKRPRWVQGPEWPMGSNSPMAFISQKRKGELTVFLFQDVDTGEIKEVAQFL